MSITFYIMCGVLIIIGFVMIFVEKVKVEPSWNSRIWFIDRSNTKDGYVFDGVEFWIDTDKIDRKSVV